MEALLHSSMDFGEVSASDRPCSSGPPRLSEPGGGVWTPQVDVCGWRAGLPYALQSTRLGSGDGRDRGLLNQKAATWMRRR